MTTQSLDLSSLQLRTLHSYLAQVSPDDSRQRMCSWKRVRTRELGVTVKPKRGNVGLEADGVMQCCMVWLCPQCGPKKDATHYFEHLRALNEWDGAVVTGTMFVFANPNRLRAAIEYAATEWRDVQRSRAFKYNHVKFARTMSVDWDENEDLWRVSIAFAMLLPQLDKSEMQPILDRIESAIVNREFGFTGFTKSSAKDAASLLRPTRPFDLVFEHMHRKTGAALTRWEEFVEASKFQVMSAISNDLVPDDGDDTNALITRRMFNHSIRLDSLSWDRLARTREHREELARIMRSDRRADALLDEIEKFCRKYRYKAVRETTA